MTDEPKFKVGDYVTALGAHHCRISRVTFGRDGTVYYTAEKEDGGGISAPAFYFEADSSPEQQAIQILGEDYF